MQPHSRVEYQYRVRAPDEAASWRYSFIAAFPELPAEVRTFDERGERMTQV